MGLRNVRYQPALDDSFDLPMGHSIEAWWVQDRAIWLSIRLAVERFPGSKDLLTDL